MERRPTMRALPLSSAIALIVALAGCRSAPVRDEPEAYVPPARIERAPAEPVAAMPADPERVAADAAPAPVAPAAARGEVQPGTGIFINPNVAAKTGAPPPTGGDVTFNWENVPLQEVIKAILGDLMQENYVIAPGVQGAVTFATSRPINAQQALGVLEMLLSWNNAALVYKDGRYTVLPTAQALPGNLRPRVGAASLARGYEVRVVPLKFVGATEMEKLLKPYAKPGAVVSADNARSMLVVAGNADELQSYMDTIETFDVNWLAGMSIGIFPLERVDAKEIVPELEKIFGEGGATPLAGMFRFLPIERMNAVLVITPQPQYLDEAERWLGRLDRGGSEGGAQLFVYYVKNVKAKDLAENLTEVFTGTRKSGSGSRDTAPIGAVVPGLESVEISSINNPPGGAAAQPQAAPSQVAAPASGSSDGIAVVESDDIKISAIEESNALMIRATASQYDAIERAIERLDVVPLQVVIEARVLQVDLTGNLSFGVRWFFENQYSSEATSDYRVNVRRFEQPGEAGNRWNSFAGTASAAGLGWTFVNTSAEAVVSAVQDEGRVEVLSAPSLLVLNNKEANINVGTQIPVVSTFFSGITSSDNTGNVNPSVNQSYVQFRDTGIILSVTPRVNPGGLVFLEIKQEKSTPGPASAAVAGNVPVNKTTVETEVAVQSGQTVMLGGLISDESTFSEGGVPFLHKIPVVGKLFGETTKNNTRKELLVLITPTVIGNAQDAEIVTDDIRHRFRGLRPLMARDAEQNPPIRPTSATQALQDNAERQPAEAVPLDRATVPAPDAPAPKMPEQ